MEEVKKNEFISGTLIVNCVHAKRLLRADMFGASDPFLAIKFADSKQLETKVINNSLYPVWN